MRHAFAVQCANGLVDGAVESVCVGKGLMREMVCFEVTPDHFDVVQFGRIFW